MHKRSHTDRCLERAAWLGGIAGGIVAVLTIVAVVPPLVGVPPPFSLPEVLGTTRLDDLGDCRPGMEVEVGKYCRFVVAGGSGGTFRVAEGGAYPPGQSVRQPNSAKVDWDGFNFTFQAVRLPEGSGTWRVLSAGMWHDIGGKDVNGNCQVGDVIQLGQFCVERATGAPFRVYGADQLYRGDSRLLFESGYAVLYWFQDGTIPSTDNGLLMPERVELGCEEQDALAFVAQRIPELSSGEERRRGGPVQWEVLEVLGEDKVCTPTPVRTSVAVQADDTSSAGEQSGAIELTVSNADGSASGSAMIEVVRRSLGWCREGTVVRSDHFCHLPDRVGGTFAVDANGYATLGQYRTDYDARGIKIDVGDPGSPNAYAIQVERISDGAWEFQVLGLWRDRGTCHAEMRLFAGEFCHPPRASDGAYRRFDVYAVDELQQNDVRTVREEDGYAVLWIGGRHNVSGSVVSAPNFYARKDGDSWTIENPGP